MHTILIRDPVPGARTDDFHNMPSTTAALSPCAGPAVTAPALPPVLRERPGLSGHPRLRRRSYETGVKLEQAVNLKLKSSNANKVHVVFPHLRDALYYAVVQ